MRLIHTADWHLGRTLDGVSLIEDQRHVLAQLIDLVRAEKPRAVLIAGDLYDRAGPAPDAVALLHETLRNLVIELQVAVVAIPGNHDNATRLGFGAEMMRASGLSMISDVRECDMPVIFELGNERVEVFAAAYAEPLRGCHELALEGTATHAAVLGEQARRARERRTPGACSIFMAHGFIAGGAASDSERPLSVGGSDLVPLESLHGFDHVLLGHLHGPQDLGTIAHYSGSPLSYSVSELTHTKSWTMLDTSTGVRRRVPILPKRAMRRVIGSLSSVLDLPPSDDFIVAKIDDAAIPPDTRRRLQERFPNLLSIERPALPKAASTVAYNPSEIGPRSDDDIIAEYVTARHNRAIADDERALIQTLLRAVDEAAEASPDAS